MALPGTLDVKTEKKSLAGSDGETNEYNGKIERDAGKSTTPLHRFAGDQHCGIDRGQNEETQRVKQGFSFDVKVVETRPKRFFILGGITLKAHEACPYRDN